MTGGLGDALREARKASGVTFERFATLAGFSESHLRSVENGVRNVTTGVAQAYDRVLDTGGMFAAAIGGHATTEAPWDQAGTLAVLTEQTRGGGVLDRRRFVVNTGATLATLIATWRRALDVPRDSATSLGLDAHALGGTRLFEHVDSRLGYLRHLDDELGSGDMARLARNEMALIVQLIKAGGMTSAAETTAYGLASEAARQVAWNLFDSDRHAAAERFFESSLRSSATAGNATAGAYAMSFMAVQHYTAGNPQDAVNLLVDAETSVAGNSTPRMRAMLAARKARAMSKTGDRRGCAHALHQARDLLAAGPHDDDPPFLYWMTPGEVEMIAGSSALELKDPAQALHYFKAAVAAEYPGDVQYPRTHAIYLARAAEAHLGLHELDDAAAQARHAAKCLGSVDSARSSKTLAGLREKLSPHTANAAVREFLQVG